MGVYGGGQVVKDSKDNVDRSCGSKGGGEKIGTSSPYTDGA